VGNTVVVDIIDDDAIAYTTPAAMEVAKLSVVQKFADSPKEAKVIPSFVNIGSNESLNLLSMLHNEYSHVYKGFPHQITNGYNDSLCRRLP
jgi:hypothetical protein